MKNLLKKLWIVWCVLTLGLCGSCVGLSTQQPAKAGVVTKASPTPSSTLIMDMVKHLNDGDAEGSLAYFADNARIYFVGMPPTGMEIYQGREALRPVWEDSAQNHFKWEVEITSSDGDRVTAKTKTWHDFTRQLEVAPNEYNDVFVVRDGRITAYT
jgi:ketosteroid isomerase-like protein